MTDTTVWKFPPKTQLQQKERTKAVAWATRKVGGWCGANVTAAIQKYLADAGFKVDQQHVKYSMQYLVENDLAIAVVMGRRTREFIMAPDVELEEPDFIRAQRVRAAGHGPEKMPAEQVALPAASVAANGHSTELVLPGRGRRMPRLPSANTAPARWADLEAACKAWHRTDPDACDLWVAGVLHDLGVDQ